MWAKNTWVKLHWSDNFTLLIETFKILFSMQVKLPSRSKNTNNKIDHSVWNKDNTTSKYIYSWFPTFSHWLVNIHEYCFASGRYMYLHRLYTGIYVLLHKFSLYKPLGYRISGCFLKGLWSFNLHPVSWEKEFIDQIKILYAWVIYSVHNFSEKYNARKTPKYGAFFWSARLRLKTQTFSY